MNLRNLQEGFEKEFSRELTEREIRVMVISAHQIKQKLLIQLGLNLMQDFRNGNLKHTFNKKLVDNKKYVKTFIEALEKDYETLK